MDVHRLLEHLRSTLQSEQLQQDILEIILTSLFIVLLGGLVSALASVL